MGSTKENIDIFIKKTLISARKYVGMPRSKRKRTATYHALITMYRILMLLYHNREQIFYHCEWMSAVTF